MTLVYLSKTGRWLVVDCPPTYFYTPKNSESLGVTTEDSLKVFLVVIVNFSRR